MNFINIMLDMRKNIKDEILGFKRDEGECKKC